MFYLNIGHHLDISLGRIKISVVNPIYRSSGSKYRSSIRYIGRQDQNIGRQDQNIGRQD
ncbi:hypothetical protein [Peribacillus tepidiphilus]|uniref:hypothetical protein n=1 Tax=Peribacillus tepidiphilus TaxID=2652445 RepID=UPI001291C584|nr:hypothetical protein [Peribacillus tepidiphilus]